MPPVSTSRSLPVERMKWSMTCISASSNTICVAAALSSRSCVFSLWWMSSTRSIASGFHMSSGAIGAPRIRIELGRVWLAQNIALPIGEIAVDGDAAFRQQAENRLQRGVIGIGLAVAIAIGGGAHVAAFARQPGPAALGR